MTDQSLSYSELQERIDQVCDEVRKHDYRSIAWAAQTLAILGVPAVEPLMEKLKDPDRYVQDAVAQALGEIRDPRPVELLLDIIQSFQRPEFDGSINDDDSSPELSAVEALGKIRDVRAVDSLLVEFERACTNNEHLLSFDILCALGDIGDPRVLNLCVSLLDSRDFEMRKSAYYALSRLGQPAIPCFVQRFLEHEDLRALRYLTEIGHVSVVPPILDLFQDQTRTSEIRKYAAIALGKLKSPQAFGAFLQYLAQEQIDPEIRHGIVQGLGFLKDHQAVEPLMKLFDSQSDEELMVTALTALAKLGQTEAIHIFITLLDSWKFSIRLWAIESLKEFGDERAIPALQRFVEDERSPQISVSEETRHNLDQIFGSDGLNQVKKLYAQNLQVTAAIAIQAIRQRSHSSVIHDSTKLTSF